MADKTPVNDNEQLMRRATYAAAIIATVIIIAKLSGWLLTGSIALLASLIDSVLDVVVSLVNMAAVHYALQPPDEEHRFGHDKAEDLATFIQSAFIGGSAVIIVYEACRRLTMDELPSLPIIGIGVSLFATILTLILVRYQRYVVKKTGSSIIAADRLHYTSDIMINIAIIASLTINKFYPNQWIDPICAIGVATYMIYSAWEIVQGAFNNLMDHEFSTDDRDAICEIINNHPEVLGMHEMKTRRSGNKRFIQFHLEMDGTISLYDAHRISDEIENMIRLRFPLAEIFIHQDPRPVR